MSRSRKQTMSIMAEFEEIARQDKISKKFKDSQVNEINRRNKQVEAYRKSKIGETNLWKLQHKEYFKKYVSGRKGPTAVYQTLVEERKLYITNILNVGYKSKKGFYQGTTNMDVARSAVNWGPKQTKGGKKYKDSTNLGNTATFNRAVAWAQRYTRTMLNLDMDSPQWQSFLKDISLRHELTEKKVTELMSIRSKSQFEAFMHNRSIYDAYGSEYISKWNKMSATDKKANNIWKGGTSSEQVEAYKATISKAIKK